MNVPKAIGLLLFAAWEVWWLHQYVTRPIPDEKMQSIAAIFFGVIVPLALLVLYVALRLAVKLFRSVKDSE